MLNRKNISISSHWNTGERKTLNEYALNNNFGIEILNFAMPHIFYKKNENQLEEAIETHRKELSNFNKVVSLHGPIRDITPHSEDEDILKIVSNRVLTTMIVAEKLGIEKVIFHTGINPVITAPGYYENICKIQAEFWDNILDEFPNQIICLENMWEPDPGMFKMILDHSNNARLKICLDVAHVNVYSKVSIINWFEELSGSIIHLHINDNNGIHDEHLAVGDGNIDWNLVVGEIGKLKNNPQVLIEIPFLKEVEKSIKYLEDNGLISK